MQNPPTVNMEARTVRRHRVKRSSPKKENQASPFEDLSVTPPVKRPEQPQSPPNLGPQPQPKRSVVRALDFSQEIGVQLSPEDKGRILTSLLQVVNLVPVVVRKLYDFALWLQWLCRCCCFVGAFSAACLCLSLWAFNYSPPTLLEIHHMVLPAVPLITDPLLQHTTCGQLRNGSTVLVWSHGLEGDHTTFNICHQNESVNWGKAFLKDDLPCFDLYTYHYQNPGLDPELLTEHNLTTRATSLLNFLESLVDGLDVKLVLFGHSYGGLLIKELFLQAKESPEPEFQHIAKVIHAFAFYGVPHRGSHLNEKCLMWSPSNWYGICDFVIDRIGSNALGELRADNPMLLDLDQRFVAAAEHLRTLNVAEKHAIHGLPLVVVPENYATMGFNRTKSRRHRHITEEADHFQVCKPASKSVLSYIKTLELLKQVML